MTRKEFKLGIISPFFFGISWIFTIFILTLMIAEFRLLDILNTNYSYLLVLVLVSILTKGIHYLSSDKVKIITISDGNFEIKIEKLPLFLKLKKQTIKASEIESFRISEGKACDRIILRLKTNEDIQFCADNLKNFFNLKDEKASLINLLEKQNIKKKKATWQDGI